MLAGAGLVLNGRALRSGARDVCRLLRGPDPGPLRVEPVLREGGVPDLGQVGHGGSLLVVVAAGETEDGETHRCCRVDEADHARCRREALLLDPDVLPGRVEVEVHVRDFHVVRPQRGVVRVEDQRGLLALPDGELVGRLEVGLLVLQGGTHLGDVGRRRLVRDAGAGVPVVRRDGPLDRVDVRDPFSPSREAARAVGLHREVGARGELPVVAALRDRAAVTLLGGGGVGHSESRDHCQGGGRGETPQRAARACPGWDGQGGHAHFLPSAVALTRLRKPREKYTRSSASGRGAPQRSQAMSTGGKGKRHKGVERRQLRARGSRCRGAAGRTPPQPARPATGRRPRPARRARGRRRPQAATHREPSPPAVKTVGVGHDRHTSRVPCRIRRPRSSPPR